MEYVSFVVIADVIHRVYYHLLASPPMSKLEENTFILSVPRDAFTLVHLVIHHSKVQVLQLMSGELSDASDNAL